MMMGLMRRGIRFTRPGVKKSQSDKIADPGFESHFSAIAFLVKSF
jgi:hypothetical protein